MIIPTIDLSNPVPNLWLGWPRERWDYFNAPGRSGYNPHYEKPGDPVGHKGLDLGADEGSGMLAALDGKVHYRVTPGTNPQAGWGLETALAVPGGWWGCRYLHCPEDGVFPALGAEVVAGEKIGLVGKSGNANYPHVHFELRWITSLRSGSLVYQGTPLDPLLYGILTDTIAVRWPTLLRPGAKAQPCVPSLSGLLYQLGFLAEVSRTRTYGPKMVTAVKEFQEERGLTVDGIVGPATRKSLIAAVSLTMGV